MSPPPGYVAYGGQNQGAYGSLRPIRGTSKALGVVMIVVIATQVASVLASVAYRGRVTDFVNGNLTSNDINGVLGIVGTIGLASAVSTLGAAVLTMIWMFRMAKNQQALGRAGTWVPGWAIGGWFVPPCVLYVIPYLMMRDIWKSSDPDSAPNWKQNPIAPLVHVWWVLFGLIPLLFVSVTINNAKFGAGKSIDETARDLNDSFSTQLLQGAAQVAAAASFLMLVRQLSARHMRVTNES